MISKKEKERRALYFDIKTECPIDKEDCWVEPVESEDPSYPYRKCRYGRWNSNCENPKCGQNIERKSKKTKPKSKRKKKCGCK